MMKKYNRKGKTGMKQSHLVGSEIALMIFQELDRRKLGWLVTAGMIGIPFVSALIADPCLIVPMADTEA